MQPVETKDHVADHSPRLLPLLFSRPLAFVSAGVVLAVAVFQLWVSAANPPGFIRDEASISLNAYDISRTLQDQDGGLLPLYFVSFGDYKSPLFVYVLAAVFRIAGPNAELARGVAAACILASVLLIGLIALRRTRSVGVATVVVALAGTTPFLFELGRVAYETAIEPLLLALVILVADWAWRVRRCDWVSATALGLALASLTYTYAGARLFAPLAAAALIVSVSRSRLRWLLTAWAVFVVGLIPLGVYSHNHPGALTARYEATTFIKGDMPLFAVIGRVVRNYFHDLNLWQWVTAGDPKPYVHTWGAGSIFAAMVALAGVGIVQILRHYRQDPFWRYAIALLVVVPIPAAVTDARYYALRLAPFPLLLALLMIPALVSLRPAFARRPWGIALAAGLAAITVVQFADFVHTYDSAGPQRTDVFEGGVPALLAGAFAGGATVYVDHDDRYAQTHALWYAASHGLPKSQVSILSDGGVAPSGGMVFGRLQDCDYICDRLAQAQDYWVARSAGPKTG